MESAAASAAAGAIDCAAELIVVVSSGGTASRAVSKYRPPCPVLVVTADEAISRQTGAFYAQYPMLVSDVNEKWGTDKSGAAVKKAVELGLCKGSGNVVVVHGPDGGDADKSPIVSFLSLSMAA